ncbi:hypothetical protein DIPPA_14463 [Diplonema papillatum]|nr:hypothetical protein DIPPA_14463 [Diplonema papillatum]
MGDCALDFAVPDVQLKKDEGQFSGPAKAVGQRKDATDKTKTMVDFYKRHDIASMISRLTAILLRDKPEDPIAHLIKHLVSPEVGVQACEDATPYMNQESADYLHKHRIHFIFDEFLTSMVDDAPVNEEGNVDIIGYAMTWMRWNKKRFNPAK